MGGAWPIKRRRRRPISSYGLKACPKCGRLNGMLQRGAGNLCAIGVGCRKGGGQVLDRGR